MTTSSHKNAYGPIGGVRVRKRARGCFFKENLEASAMAAKNQNLSVDKWRNLRIYSSNLNKIVEIRTANRFIFKRALAFIKKS